VAHLQEQALLSPSCCNCGAELLHCSTACLTQCVDDPISDACYACQLQRSCIAPFESCSGMNYAVDVLGRDPSAAPPTEAETTYYSLGEPGRISFTNSVAKLWESGAPGLAVMVAVASGANPYLECVLLGLAWFVPMPSSQRGRLLWWVNRVGRWSFLDIFVVVFLCTGLNLQLAGGSIQLAVETKFCIYAFGIATVWARIIGTYVEAGHRRCAQGGADAKIACRCVLALPRKRLEMLLLASSTTLLVLTICGMVFPFITFGTEIQSAGVREERTYSAVTLGSAAGSADLAGLSSMLLLVVPYCLWGVLLPAAVSTCLLLSLALGLMGHHSSKKLIIGVCDMVGSAASLDVLVLAAGVSTIHFGELVTESVRCVDENMADDWLTSSKVASGFFLMCAAAPAQWIMQEVCLALRDSDMDAEDVKQSHVPAVTGHTDVEDVKQSHPPAGKVRL